MGIHSSTISSAENISGMGLRCDYSSENAEALLDSDCVLAVFGFNSPLAIPDDPRYIATGLSSLGDTYAHEVWYCSQAVEYGYERQSGIQWSGTGDLLLASLVIEEPAPRELTELVQRGYQQLLRFIGDRGCPHIIRAWNYMADINAGVGDQERYKRFCVGRHNAFMQHDKTSLQFPAACALGHSGGPLVIYLLASAAPATYYENPSQISAYHYPREYGPESPSFARASLKSWDGYGHIYLSGTASVVGHRSQHSRNINKQLDVTFENINSLLDHVQDKAGLAHLPEPCLLRIYVRRAENFALVKAAVEKKYGKAKTMYFLADVCRSELEVEIDGLCELIEPVAC